jgi:hypothetical protein
MSVIDRIKAKHKAAGRKSKEIPEWGDDAGPLVVYWTPLTIEEQGVIYRATQKSGLAGLARALVLKCEDDAGNKIFDEEDYIALRKAADGKTVAEVANAILDVESVKDMEKNLEAIRD